MTKNMLSAYALLGIFALASSSDIQCTSQGGSCLDWRYYKCTAGYETGMCDGDSNRQCCMACNSVCVSQENNEQACCDSECTNAGGTCMDNSNYCPAGYSSGMCGGSASRQCCDASSSGGGSSGGACINYNRYGNIMDIATDGCSASTASQDGYSKGGVSSSNGMAQTDLNNMNKYKSEILNVADSLCVAPSVIAGIISRESRAGAALDSNGYGDNGNGYGLMQIDIRYHTPVGGPYSQAHINQGTGILIDMINGVKANHPTWTDDMNLKGGICAYNSGVSNVQTYDNMDQGTTGNDYSDDVVARAQWYDGEGYP